MEGAEAAKYVGEMRDASQFYGNRVVKEYKDRFLHLKSHVNDSGDTTHKEWQTSFTEILNELQKYVRKHFPQGIKWNAAGAPADSFVGANLETPSTGPSASATPIPNAGGAGAPPPPPPPPPAPAPESLMPKSTPAAAPTDQGSTIAAVFSQLNQGEGITKSLKRVDKSQMTHKNPSLREKKTSPNPPAKPASLRRNASGASTTSTSSPSTTSKTGKKQLEGVKWIIVRHPCVEGTKCLMGRKTSRGKVNLSSCGKMRRIFRIRY
jgi:adenylyl cyclase-associated protein